MPLTPIKISSHAIQRFQQRFAPDATDEQTQQILLELYNHPDPRITLIVIDGIVVTAYPRRDPPRHLLPDALLERRRNRQQPRLRHYWQISRLKGA